MKLWKYLYYIRSLKPLRCSCTNTHKILHCSYIWSPFSYVDEVRRQRRSGPWSWATHSDHLVEPVLWLKEQCRVFSAMTDLAAWAEETRMFQPLVCLVVCATKWRLPYRDACQGAAAGATSQKVLKTDDVKSWKKKTLLTLCLVFFRLVFTAERPARTQWKKPL